MSTTTATQQLLEVRLGRPLSDYLADLRKQGKSWRQVAAEVGERTGLDVSYETCRQWSREAQSPEVRAS